MVQADISVCSGTTFNECSQCFLGVIQNDRTLILERDVDIFGGRFSQQERGKKNTKQIVRVSIMIVVLFGLTNPLNDPSLNQERLLHILSTLFNGVVVFSIDSCMDVFSKPVERRRISPKKSPFMTL